MHLNIEHNGYLNAIFHRLDCVNAVDVAGWRIPDVEFVCLPTDFVDKLALVSCLVNASTVMVLDVHDNKTVTLATNATTLSAAVVLPERNTLLLMWYEFKEIVFSSRVISKQTQA